MFIGHLKIVEDVSHNVWWNDVMIAPVSSKEEMIALLKKQTDIMLTSRRTPESAWSVDVSVCVGRLPDIERLPGGGWVLNLDSPDEVITIEHTGEAFIME